MTETEFRLICEGCGYFKKIIETRDVELVDYKEVTCNYLGTAEVGKQIHEIKSNHRPYIMTVSYNEEGDVVDMHVPAWAEGGVRPTPAFEDVKRVVEDT